MPTIFKFNLSRQLRNEFGWDKPTTELVKRKLESKDAKIIYEGKAWRLIGKSTNARFHPLFDRLFHLLKLTFSCTYRKKFNAVIQEMTRSVALYQKIHKSTGQNRTVWINKREKMLQEKQKAIHEVKARIAEIETQIVDSSKEKLVAKRKIKNYCEQQGYPNPHHAERKLQEEKKTLFSVVSEEELEQLAAVERSQAIRRQSLAAKQEQLEALNQALQLQQTQKQGLETRGRSNPLRALGALFDPNLQQELNTTYIELEALNEQMKVNQKQKEQLTKDMAQEGQGLAKDQKILGDFKMRLPPAYAHFTPLQLKEYLSAKDDALALQEKVLRQDTEYLELQKGKEKWEKSLAKLNERQDADKRLLAKHETEWKTYTLRTENELQASLKECKDKTEKWIRHLFEEKDALELIRLLQFRELKAEGWENARVKLTFLQSIFGTLKLSLSHEDTVNADFAAKLINPNLKSGRLLNFIDSHLTLISS